MEEQNCEVKIETVNFLFLTLLLKLKHRHARRARVIFCELKVVFGDSRIESMTCKMFY